MMNKNNPKHIHILGIGGTFMSGLALIARAQGIKVTGNDQNCYSPIKELLAEHQVSWQEGYENSTDALQADLVLVGNVIQKNFPILKSILNSNIPVQSGPQWLYDQVLKHKKVVAVSGTLGKTTTTSMLIHILTEAGDDPGFLVGGVLPDKNTNAKLSDNELFVIEADEYDCAYFDKRPKFLHYHPDVLLINNIEFDHADIYADLKAIQNQFQNLVQSIPKSGVIIAPSKNKVINEVLINVKDAKISEWSIENSQADWFAKLKKTDASEFEIFHYQKSIGTVQWDLMGLHNIENALAAVTAAVQLGISPDVALEAIMSFKPVKRRLELKYNTQDIFIYDDFAHHPTAIEKTIQAVKKSSKHKRIFVVMEFASYSMKKGLHAKQMRQTFVGADKTFILKPDAFDFDTLASGWGINYELYPDTDAIADSVSQTANAGDAILIMSNRSFDSLDKKINARLEMKH